MLKFRKWYFLLLLDPKSNFRVTRFFSELEPIFIRIYPSLRTLINKKGRKPVDYCFQFRWLIWWKFFGSSVLQKAFREFNRSDFLKKTLNCPVNTYSREVFHYFRKKIKSEEIEQWGSDLIKEFHKHKLITFKTIVIDSFPIKSYLNTSKCLKVPKIDYNVLKQFINTISLDEIITIIDSSPKVYNKVKTKIIGLLVKEIWDLQTWPRCWKVLTGKKAINHGISLPHYYKSFASFKSIDNEVYRKFKAQNIEKKIIAKVKTAFNSIGITPLIADIKTIKDLNGTWHLPHRWRDPDISHYHCTSKHEYGYGRGGILVVIPDLELPLLIKLTPKYKQSNESICKLIDSLHKQFGSYFQGSKLIADSEFGVSNLIQYFKKKLDVKLSIPLYGSSKNKPDIPQEDINTRKVVERVIGRLDNNWKLEHPRHLGSEYAAFHLQITRFCDILQVIFNQKIGNKAHPHAVIPFRG